MSGTAKRTMGASSLSVLCVFYAAGAVASAFQLPLTSPSTTASSALKPFSARATLSWSHALPQLASLRSTKLRIHAGAGSISMQTQKFELMGMVKLINDKMTFDSGFTKREFVVTTDEMYPQDVKFEVVKDRCALLDTFAPGEYVKVSFNIRGNQWQGKYFVNLQAWRIEKLEAGGLAAQVEKSINLADWDGFGSQVVDTAKPAAAAPANPAPVNPAPGGAANGKKAGGSFGWDDDIPF